MKRILLGLLLFTSSSLLAQISSDSVVVIKNVSLWDGLSETVTPNAQVIIVHNLIKQVGNNLTVPKGAKVIDGKGKTLIPGLSDAHLHIMLNVSMSAVSNNAYWAYVSARATKSVH